MSQAGIISEGPGGGDVKQLTGDLGGAVGPDGAHNINILTGSGLTTTGNPATHTITISQDSFQVGTGTTIGAVTADLITIPLGAIATTYIIEARIAGFESTTPAGAGYLIVGTVRTTGAAATVIGSSDNTTNEDPVLAPAAASVNVSGNNAIVQVLGAAGFTINWKATSLWTRQAP